MILQNAYLLWCIKPSVMTKAVLALITIIFAACATSHVIVSQQGIEGKVTWVEGNRMPGPNKITPSPKPVMRQIYVYDLVKLNELERIGALFSEPKKKPVAIFSTNDTGEFKHDLPEGTYSVFTKEEGGLFANSFDGNNNVMPVTVESGNYIQLNITINYKAVY